MENLESELKEFIAEAEDLLNDVENSLLQIEQGATFKSHFNSIFRAFHSIKGASGMLELVDLQQHMHKLENIFQTFNDKDQISSSATSFFLQGIDAARLIMKGERVQFN